MWFSLSVIACHDENTISISSAYPATSCSSRVAKVLICRFDSKPATSRSDRLPPSIRVDEPTLSMVATRRSADRRSGASVPKARHAPLNSSIVAIRRRISGVICRVSARIMKPILRPITPIIQNDERPTSA